MPDSTDVDSLKAGDIVKFVMGELGFIKGVTSSPARDAGTAAEITPEVDPSVKLKELQEAKKKAIDDEDFKRAKELKAEIEKLEEQIKNAPRKLTDEEMEKKLK